MANTYQLINSNTVGSGGTGSITFSSIPATYTDLCLVLSIRTTNAADNDTIDLEINGVTTNQSRKRLQGNGSTVASASASSLGFQVNGDTSTANTFGSAQIYIPNYAGSNNKSLSFENITENNATTAYANLIAGLWSQTTAITSLGIVAIGSTIKQYSTAYLYGIKNS
jgi:hypothetical protein